MSPDGQMSPGGVGRNKIRPPPPTETTRLYEVVISIGHDWWKGSNALQSNLIVPVSDTKMLTKAGIY